MHTGNQIWKRLNVNLEWLSGAISLSKLKRELDSLLKPYGAKVKLVPISFSSKKHWYMIGGEYTPGKYHMPIDIELCYNRNKTYIYFTEKRRKRFIFLLNQTLQHELVHKIQFKTKGDEKFYTHHFYFQPGKTFSSHKRLEYLAIVEELEAYAHDLAMEIKYHYPHIDPKQIIENIDSFSNLTTWKMYRRAFKRTKWNHVRTELLRKTNKWLPHIKENFNA